MRLSAAGLAVLLAIQPLAAAPTRAPSALERDMSYYQRVAKSQRMTPNDRLHLLYRLKEKHAGVKTDMTPLLREISRWEAAKDGKPLPPASVEKPAQAKTAAAAAPSRPAAVPPKNGAVMDDNYLIQRGDLLDVRVIPAGELDRELSVQPDGTISFPLLGAVRAENMTRSALERALRRDLSTYVIEPVVRVSVRRFADDAVIVAGRVATPGAVPHREELDVFQAVVAAGGFLKDADRAAVNVHRGRGAERQTLLVDARAPLSKDDPARLTLKPGDIVDVAQAGDVSILGMVAKPGNYPYKDNFSLLELVFQAGGLSPGAGNPVHLYRQSDAGRRSQRVNLRRIMDKSPADDPLLKPGDIVMVPQRSLRAGSPGSTTLVTVLTAAAVAAAVVLAAD